VSRFAPAALVAALLVGTAVAFAYAERLKLTRSPLFGTHVVNKVFSPTCACATDTTRIVVELRHRDRITVVMIDHNGDVVRTIVADRPRPRGRIDVAWNGRDDAGRVVPDGSYRPRVKLALDRRTIVLPNPIRVDTTPPHVELLDVKPQLFSPDGDGHADRVSARYRVNEPARGILYVNGRQHIVTYRKPTEGRISWDGRVGGRVVRPGVYRISVGARDPAGNLGSVSAELPVVLRYIAIGRKRIVVKAGARFALRVSADATSVEWRLGSRTGTLTPGTVHFRAPAYPGRYTLTLREGEHAVRAAVFVKAAS
jgi:hypothetical protein